MYSLKLKREKYKEKKRKEKERRKKEKKKEERETFVFKTVCWCNIAGTLNICLIPTY